MWPDLIQTGNAGYFPKDKLGTRWTYEFQGVRQQIDYILLSDAIKDITRKIAARTIGHNNTLASDHRPLVVTLDLR